MTLPDINPESITTLAEARNAIEKLLQAYTSLKAENELLKAEVARLKGQPRKPQFNSLTQRDFGVSKLLKVGKKWSKGSKKGILPIDTHINLPEETICSCGSSDFKSLRTHTKIVQGMIFKRNNTAYHGRDKQCVNCVSSTQFFEQIFSV